MDLQASILEEVNLFTFCSAGMAAICLVHPLDLIKTRMQLSNVKTTAKTEISAILKNQGVPALYSGLSASLFRHAAYTTTRLGIYTLMFDSMVDLALRNSDPNAPTIWIWAIKIGLGTVTACISSFAWSPAELAFIRIAADSRLSVEERRNYKNVFDAMVRISREEGFCSLWRGAFLTTGCMVAGNGIPVLSYFFIGPILTESVNFEGWSGIITFGFITFCISNLATAAIITPVDVIKTRVQNMKTTSGRPIYSDTLDVLTDVIRQEGIFALWKGFLPQCARNLLYNFSTPLFIAILYGAFEA